MKIRVFFILFCFVLVYPKTASAVFYFSDDFSQTTLDKWVVGQGTVQNAWSVSDSRLFSNVSKGNWSNIYPMVDGQASWNNYKLEAEVENVGGVDQNFFVRVSNDRMTFYQVGIRYSESAYPIDCNNIVVYKFVNGTYQLITTYPSALIPRFFDLTQGVKHKLKIVVDDSNIIVHFDGALAVSFADSEPILSGGVGMQAWSGASPVASVSFVDNFAVSSLDETASFPNNIPTVTPTETPTPTSSPTPTVTPTTVVKKKIIFLPGLGASWNTDAFVYGKKVNQNEWKMTPFVKNYENLLKAFELNGLEKGKDYYVWNYDWRRPVAEIESELNTFINKNVSQQDKLTLVGHSLGGVVARVWSQNHSSDQRLDKVIGLGSPQQGSAEAYLAWNGVNLGGSVDFYNVALNVVAKLNGEKSVRTFAPILKDIFPTYDFLRVNGKVKKANEIAFANDYLKNINKSGYGDLTSAVGVGEKTKEWINLRERNRFDRVLGTWEDGSYSSVNIGPGDGTVLVKSASVGTTTTINSNHGDIVDKEVNLLLGKLGLGTTIVQKTNNNLSNKLLFFLGSPAKMSVWCDGKFVSEDVDGFVTVDNSGYKDCQIRLVGTDNGTYHLVTGKIGDEDSWHYFENEIGVGKTQNLIVETTSGQLSCKNQDYIYSLIERDWKRLTNRRWERRDIDKITKEVFDYRRQKNETEITNRIIDNLELLLACNHKNNKTTKIRWFGMRLWLDLLEHGKNPSRTAAENYHKIREIMDRGEENHEAKMILIGKLAENVL